MKSFDQLWGVDFGSKMAGTTVVCYYTNAIHFLQSDKNQNADLLLNSLMETQPPSLIMIDAPLSLPAIYTFKNFEPADFFYRQCDRDLGAMSPMFLGGLTARAMQMKKLASDKGIRVLETYPAAQARKLGFADYKKENCQSLGEQIAEKYALHLGDKVVNQHQLDALLAFAGGINYLQNNFESVGKYDEGVIII
ncbi:MAG: hypothetical protein ACOCXH_15185 [Cyclobacteriaceae bacterium]